MIFQRVAESDTLSLDNSFPRSADRLFLFIICTHVRVQEGAIGSADRSDFRELSGTFSFRGGIYRRRLAVV